MDIQLAVLRARKVVLKKPLPAEEEPPSAWVSNDPFSFESRGFYAPALSGREDSPSRNAESSGLQLSKIIKKKKKVGKASGSAVQLRKDKGGRVEKPTRTRFVPNWTPEMDKILRKSMRKWGWGSWTRIERSGKLPKEYTSKIIARRVKALGFSREQFEQNAAAQKHARTNTEN